MVLILKFFVLFFLLFTNGNEKCKNINLIIPWYFVFVKLGFHIFFNVIYNSILFCFFSSSFQLCTVNPCANAGTCWTSDESFYCACRPGFTGKMCEGKFRNDTANDTIVLVGIYVLHITFITYLCVQFFVIKTLYLFCFYR